MKLLCDDGIVRRFRTSRCDGEWRNGLRVLRSEEAVCIECDAQFGVHDVDVLKPMFKQHVCDGRAPKGRRQNETGY